MNGFNIHCRGLTRLSCKVKKGALNGVSGWSTGKDRGGSFDDGDDVVGGLAEVARRENIRVACFNLVGEKKHKGQTYICQKK